MSTTQIDQQDPSGPFALKPGSGTARLYRVPEAMALLSLSRSVLYEQIRAGRLKSVTQRRTRLIPDSAIADYVALLMQEADDGAP
jgi:excisionase family DNA binding protein